MHVVVFLANQQVVCLIVCLSRAVCTRVVMRALRMQHSRACATHEGAKHNASGPALSYRETLWSQCPTQCALAGVMQVEVGIPQVSFD